jgi:hypothetical protein
MATKEVRVHATSCTPGNLELLADDQVVFVKGGPDAPALVHVDRATLFGTKTCKVGSSRSDATVYTPKNPGNYTIGLRTSGGEELKVLCLGTAARSMSVTGTGGIKVTG